MKQELPYFYDMEGWRFHTRSFIDACSALGVVEYYTNGISGTVTIAKGPINKHGKRQKKDIRFERIMPVVVPAAIIEHLRP